MKTAKCLFNASQIIRRFTAILIVIHIFFGGWILKVNVNASDDPTTQGPGIYSSVLPFFGTVGLNGYGFPFALNPDILFRFSGGSSLGLPFGFPGEMPVLQPYGLPFGLPFGLPLGSLVGATGIANVESDLSSDGFTPQTSPFSAGLFYNPLFYGASLSSVPSSLNFVDPALVISPWSDSLNPIGYPWQGMGTGIDYMPGLFTGMSGLGSLFGMSPSSPQSTLVEIGVIDDGNGNKSSVLIPSILLEDPMILNLLSNDPSLALSIGFQIPRNHKTYENHLAGVTFYSYGEGQWPIWAQTYKK